MSDMDALVSAYESHVALRWPDNLSPVERVWMVIYPPRDERRVRARITAFETATLKAHHAWKLIDVTDCFARWLGEHPYRQTYFEQPALLSAASLNDFETFLARWVIEQAAAALSDADGAVAVLGVGSLFPFTRVSRLIESLAPLVNGRLVIFFPGDRDGANYRLLEARDGWNYLATPISATEEMH